MRSPELDCFLRLLEECRLLDDRQLRKTRAWASGGKVPESIAGKLVRRGHLTRWQARQLLAGRNGPFFLGHYKILKSLGQGGMGSVFKAIQPAINRTVALKVMSRRMLKDERAILRFQREIRAAGALDHPHIVHAFDAGCVKNTYFLVMEYLEGHDLKQWIMSAGPLPIDWSCECIRQAALGLQYAHERGIVHRDIKPSNLLLVQKSKTEWPHLKITDFGLARVGMDVAAETGLTRIGQGLGTSEYIAPEQAQDSTKVDIRADIYGLGCTLFELLTGQLPFNGTSPVERLMARFKQNAPRTSSLRPAVPPGLDQIVARMLDPDPDRRFQTPTEVAQALLPFSRLEQAAPLVLKNGSAGVSEGLSAAALADTNSALEDTDPALDQFLNSLSGELSSNRSFPNLPKPGIWNLLRARSVYSIAVLAVLLWIVVFYWSLGARS